MRVEPGHDPADGENVPRPTTQNTPAAQPIHYNSARHGSHVEESPELLRWRADLLMDEMMMGGVDVSAADSHRTFSGVDAPVVQRPKPATNGSSYLGDHAQQDHIQRDYGRTPHEGNRGYDSPYSGAVEPDLPATGEKGYNGHANGAYPSPASSDHFGSESLRPVEPRAYEAASDSYRPETRQPEARQLEERAPLPIYEPKSFDVHSEPSGAENDIANSPTRYSEPLNDAPLNSAPPNNDALSERGIPAPRRYPEQYPESRGDRQPDQPVDPSLQRRADEAQEPGAQTEASSDYMPPLRTTMDGAPAMGSDEQAARSDRLYSVEQQYEQFRRQQSSNIEPVEPARPAVRPPLPPVEPSRPNVPPRVTPPPVDQQTEWATGPNKWDYQDFSADPNAPEEESLFAGYVPERKYVPDSPVRHDPAEFVSAMSVIGSNKKRSTLLPRSTELDIDTLHREISDLHGEIAALLPVGNETSERAKHLLDKAYSILQSDPSRSAEVEYYMQQVRTIVLRLHQSRQWSDLYRKRLHVYLLGWLGLSAMALLARFLFQMDLEDALVWVTGVGWDSWMVAHWATFVGTVAAGAFGGALGALYTMQGHARGEYSFFDRKYGLRGLILPFMGAIVAALGYVIFGLAFALLGINPAESLTAAIVPTTVALAFGFSQESIYGTRD